MILFDVQDQRKIGDGVKIDIDEAKLYAIADAVGINHESDVVEVKIRIRDVEKGKPSAQVRPLSSNSFRLVIRLLPKAELSDKAKYVINNGLVHEMRHVAQFVDFGHVVIAMEPEKYEEEAQEFGRLARIENKGKDLWAIS